MSNDNYHPDGFVPMQNASVDGFNTMPKNKLIEDIAALERGLAFMHELKEEKTIKTKPMSFTEAEELIAANQGLTFAAIRAVERFHGIS